jgi:hypothetical protein
MTIADRVKAIRARARIQRWEYRQRNLAHGAWNRFRLALAHAREAYAIDESAAAALAAEGFATDERGRGLEPPRTIVWITPARAAGLEAAKPIVLRLDAELLAARSLALVPFV